MNELQKKMQARIISLARGEVGNHEEPMGSNDGPEVRKYQAVTGAYHAEWCNSFTSWLGAQIGETHVPRTADTWATYNWARDNKVLVDKPTPGDYFLELGYQGTDMPKHIGLVATVNGNRFTTVEGNVGDSVKSYPREITGPNQYKFVNWLALYTEEEYESGKLFYNPHNGKLSIVLKDRTIRIISMEADLKYSG